MYTLYSYYRSSCSWRVRLVLELKAISYEIVPVNLLQNSQQSEEYLSLNPSGNVPTLLLEDGRTVAQSVAIMEYLEESYPSFPLLPTDPILRAQIRRLVQIIVSDCQPLQNLRVIRQLQEFSSESEVRSNWATLFIRQALTAYQIIILNCPSSCTFSLSNTITLADICLIPQLYNARRFGISVEEEFPHLAAIESAVKIQHPEAFSRAHPDNQPDCIK